MNAILLSRIGFLLTVLAIAGCRNPAIERALKAPTGVPHERPHDLPVPSVRKPLPQRPGSTTPAQIRRVTLGSVIADALRHSDTVQVLSGGRVETDSITPIDLAILDNAIVRERAQFDPQVSWGYIARGFDEPPDSIDPLDRSSSFTRNESDFFARMSKRWTTGATTSIGYEPPLAYQYLPTYRGDDFNPAYDAALRLGARQPLLRGAGKDVNRAPIRVSQLRQQQSAWELKEALLARVRSVEESYWRLQAAYVALQAIERVLPLLNEAVRIEELRLQVELVTRAEVARVRLQRDSFVQDRARALADVRENEYQLRNLLGLPPHDNAILVPVDVPQMNDFALQHEQVLETALVNRPDLIRRQLELQVREVELGVARNGVMPRLDLEAVYRSRGRAPRLDNAVDELLTFDYADWTAGLTFSIPIGNRAARSELQIARHQYARDRALLAQRIENVSFRLADILREIHATGRQYQIARNRLKDAEEWVKIARIRFRTPPPAGRSRDWLIVALDDYQFALRTQVDALTDASSLIARYNVLLARLEEAQGTLLDKRQIQLVDENAPHAAPHVPPAPAASGHSTGDGPQLVPRKAPPAKKDDGPGWSR